MAACPRGLRMADAARSRRRPKRRAPRRTRLHRRGSSAVRCAFALAPAAAGAIQRRALSRTCRTDKRRAPRRPRGPHAKARGPQRKPRPAGENNSNVYARASATTSPTFLPNTMMSHTALPPMRLSPWMPPVTSPAAYRPGIGLPDASSASFFSLIFTPPIS